MYSAAHFFVDFACAFLFFSCLDKGASWMLYILLYNFFAFACQMPLGIIADSVRKNTLIAVLGMVLIAAAPAVASIPIALCVVIGLGNAMFHIGAGRDVLCRTQGYGALGVFVSPGAIGLYLGTLLGKTGTVTNYAATMAMVVVAILVYIICKEDEEASTAVTPTTAPKLGLFAVLGIAALFLVVVLRSYVGTTLAFPWKDAAWGVVLVCALALGKAVGGFLADALGDVRVSAATLLLAAVLFCFSSIPMLGVLAVFLFNMSMPITLGAVCRYMPRHKGFGFGLLTFALFVGIIPMVIGAEAWLTLPYGFALACVVSAALLVFGLKVRGTKNGS